MENKKTKIISVVAVVALALTIITATYAYFNAQVGDPASADIKVTANTVDTFTFSNGNAISFSINQDNFASGKGNQTGSTYASATLTANNKTNTATEHYYLYLNIEDNTFTYSINENTPEIIMTVTDSAGTEITDISTLTHVIVTGANGTQVSGYDITNKSGLITLFNNREITTTSSKEEKWNITITFVNYDASQNANAGKNLSAKVMIQKKKYALHNNCNDSTLSCHAAKLYTGTQGENNIYYHDGNLENGIDDKSYRYSGASDSVNNYVCFGSSETTCPTENLYRIIGVIDGKIKLIKSTMATSTLLGTDGDYYSETSYYWNKNATTNGKTNTWGYSLLNLVNLNTNFITKIGEEWANKIATTTWKVGGNTWENMGTVVPATAYQNEVVEPVTTNSKDNAKECSAKIGLMYVSDYEFAAIPTYWTYVGYNYSDSTKDYRAAKTSNWMYMGLYEWTISRYADNSNVVFYVSSTGSVGGSYVDNKVVVRPVFYLKSSVTYVSGTGTSSDPIIITD